MGRPKKENLTKGTVAENAAVPEEDLVTEPEITTPEPDMTTVVVNETEQSAGTISVKVLSTDTNKETPVNGQVLVKVNVSYPKDFKGNRYLPEGERELSAESAEILIRKGIAKMV